MKKIIILIIYIFLKVQSLPNINISCEGHCFFGDTFLNISYPSDCYQLSLTDQNQSGIETIFISGKKENDVTVECDQTTDGGGWTVIQSRRNIPVRENFHRSWIEYKLGFGNAGQENWIGLENMHYLTNSKLMELRIELEDWEGNTRYAEYDYFYVADSASNYQLRIGNYSGNAGDCLNLSGNKNAFSTYDSDNDNNENDHCAIKFSGGFWFGHSSRKGCHCANVNGFPHQGSHKSYADGINWHYWKGYQYSLKTVTMKIRPAFH